MALSDDLAKLSVRAKQAEDKAAAAKQQAKADRERTMNEVRAAAQARAEKLQQSMRATTDEAAARWKEVQTSWGAHLATMRQRIDAKKSQVDAKVAENDARDAEADAELAIDFAYAAIEEAELAVIYAITVRANADEAAAKAATATT